MNDATCKECEASEYETSMTEMNGEYICCDCADEKSDFLLDDDWF